MRAAANSAQMLTFGSGAPPGAAARPAKQRDQRRFARYSAFTALVTPASLVGVFNSVLGLAQRIVIAVVLAWLTSLAAQVHCRDLVQR
jgi:hypothetical protein